MASEKSFENRLKAWLISQGIYPAGTPKQNMMVSPYGWFFKVWGGGFQQSGIPDLLMCLQGVFFAIELKATGGTATDLQKLNIAAINQSGGVGIILQPEGFEQFKNIVKGVKNLSCKSVTAELNALIIANTNTNCVIWKG